MTKNQIKQYILWQKKLPPKARVRKTPTPAKAKLSALAQAMGNIEKNFGRGAIMKLGDEQIEDVDVIPSGSIGLNYALGVGGYPRGRIIEIYGPESSGKTTLAIHAIAEAQKNGGIAAIIDAEHAFDRFYAEKLGVDVNNLLISQPDNGEQALEIAEQLIRSSAIDILVVDSGGSPYPPRARLTAIWATRMWAFRLDSCHRPCVSSLPPSRAPTHAAFSSTSCVRKSV